MKEREKETEKEIVFDCSGVLEREKRERERERERIKNSNKKKLSLLKRPPKAGFLIRERATGGGVVIGVCVCARAREGAEYLQNEKTTTRAKKKKGRRKNRHSLSFPSSLPVY